MKHLILLILILSSSNATYKLVTHIGEQDTYTTFTGHSSAETCDEAKAIAMSVSSSFTDEEIITDPATLAYCPQYLNETLNASKHIKPADDADAYCVGSGTTPPSFSSWLTITRLKTEVWCDYTCNINVDGYIMINPNECDESIPVGTTSEFQYTNVKCDCPDSDFITRTYGLLNPNYIDNNTSSNNCDPVAPEYTQIALSQSECTSQALFNIYQTGELDGTPTTITDLLFDLCSNTCYGVIRGCPDGKTTQKGFCVDPEVILKNQCPAPGIMQCYDREYVTNGSVDCTSSCYCNDTYIDTVNISCDNTQLCADGYVFESQLNRCLTEQEYADYNRQDDYENNTTVVTVTEDGNTTTTTTTESHWDSDTNQTVTTTTTTTTDINGSTTSNTSITYNTQNGINPDLDTKDLNKEKTQQDILDKLDDILNKDKESTDLLSSIDSKLLTEQNFTNAMVEALSEFFDPNNDTNGSIDSNSSTVAPDGNNSPDGCPAGWLYDVISGECKQMIDTTVTEYGGGDGNGTSDTNGTSDSNGTDWSLDTVKSKLTEMFEIDRTIFDTNCPTPSFSEPVAYMQTTIEDPLYIFDQNAEQYYAIIRGFFIAFATIGGLMLIFTKD